MGSEWPRGERPTFESPWPKREDAPAWIVSRSRSAAIQRQAFWRNLSTDPSTRGHWWWRASGDPPREAVYQLCRGWLPKGMTVRPTCSSPTCVNPSHQQWFDPAADF